MTRVFDVIRGDTKIGEIVLDGSEPGGLFRPTSAFDGIQCLFQQEVIHLDASSESRDQAKLLVLADQCQQLIMEPGIVLCEQGQNCTFELVGLTIDGDRAIWR